MHNPDLLQLIIDLQQSVIIMAGRIEELKQRVTLLEEKLNEAN